MEPFPIRKAVSSSPEETMAAGERLAQFLGPASVVALRGPLGAGKTCFTKGIARGLGITEEVTSPTYTIISEYAGIIPFYHIDAYRLSGDEDFDALGGEEYIYGRGVAVVEWSERLPRSLPKDAFIVDIALDKENSRIISISSPAHRGFPDPKGDAG